FAHARKAALQEVLFWHGPQSSKVAPPDVRAAVADGGLRAKNGGLASVHGNDRLDSVRRRRARRGRAVRPVERPQEPEAPRQQRSRAREEDRGPAGGAAVGEGRDDAQAEAARGSAR